MMIYNISVHQIKRTNISMSEQNSTAKYNIYCTESNAQNKIQNSSPEAKKNYFINNQKCRF